MFEHRLLILVFVFGLLIGSFLNVCIYRIPKHENITTTRSHCIACGNVIRWFDLIPVISFLLLRGKCRNCGAKLSIQYPVIELLNGILYCVIYAAMGLTEKSVLTMLLASALIVIAVIDWRTYEKPFGLNVFIAAIGIADIAFKLINRDFTGIFDNLIGAVCVSGFLMILYIATKGRGIGGGDIKLMAAAGLFLGWKNIILAFVIGCVLGSVIHLIRMKVSKQDHVLAFGPYLAVGIFVASVWGTQIVNAYLETLKV